MKKVFVITLAVAMVIGLSVLVGCSDSSSKNESTAETETVTPSASVSDSGEDVSEAENTIISHTVSRSSSEFIFTIEVDKNNKLKYYTQKSVYRASTQENYEEACEEYTEIVNSENAEGYDFRTSDY